MKRITLLLVALALFAPQAVLMTGCQTGSTTQAETVTTLKVLGATVDAAMTTAANLLKNGQITVAQWKTVSDFHDQKFQPAYAVAVAAANSNINSVASPDLIALGTQIGALVLQLQNKTAPTT